MQTRTAEELTAWEQTGLESTKQYCQSVSSIDLCNLGYRSYICTQ